MNIKHLNHRICVPLLGLIVFLALGCTDKNAMAYVSPTANKIKPQPSAAPVALAPNAAVPIAVATDQRGVVADGWIAIKDDSYDQRSHFISGLQALEKGLDRLIATMNTQNGSGSDTTRDAYMTEMTAARINLQNASAKVDQATAATWMSDKVRVAQAWIRMQASFSKAQSG